MNIHLTHFPDMTGPVSRAHGPETINYYTAGPLNRVSFLRSDYAFLDAALKHPSAKFLPLDSLNALMRRSSSESSKLHELVFVGYKDVAEIVGDPYNLDDQTQISQWCSASDRVGIRKVIVVFLGIEEGISSTTSSSDAFSYKGTYVGTPYFAVDVTEDNAFTPELKQKVSQLSKSLAERHNAEYRALMFGPRVIKPHYALYGQARMYVDWNARNRFCGGCGHPTMTADGGCKLVCPPRDNGEELPPCHTRGRISNLSFPRTDTSIIVAVVNHDNDKLLIARGKRFPESFYSCIAGFLEPSEGIEDCVRREVWEETGVKVGRVVVHSTQPWPYPANIMVGCIAEIQDADPESHAIHLGHDPELADAKWVPFSEVRKALNLSLTTNRHTFEPGKESDFLVPGPEAIAHVLFDAVVSGRYLTAKI